MNVYTLLADGILISHAAVILFIVGGLVCVLVGGFRGWGWVRNRWFRTVHLLAIGYVVLQSLAGMTCPLTDWENALRVQGGENPYESGGFIAHWLHRLIFFRAEPWVFTVVYTAFGLLVATTMIFIPPKWRGKEGNA